ncbi:MAG: ribbon-helix-helix protein, CopG family [Leptospirillum sp.]
MEMLLGLHQHPKELREDVSSLSDEFHPPLRFQTSGSVLYSFFGQSDFRLGLPKDSLRYPRKSHYPNFIAYHPILPNFRPDLQNNPFDNHIVTDAHHKQQKRREREVRKQFCSIRLPEEIFREIEKIAKKEDRTRSAVIRRIVQQFFSKEGTDESDNHRKNDCSGNNVGTGGGL